jgi:Na+-translocating ferredoxin:NAD+ oxidoreductase subunit B
MLETLIIFLILGLLLGGILAFASVKFHVETDPKLDEIIEALPGANCGACGYPGCSGCGKAIFEGKAAVNSCPVGGSSTAEAIAGIMGIEANSDQNHLLPELNVTEQIMQKLFMNIAVLSLVY